MRTPPRARLRAFSANLSQSSAKIIGNGCVRDARDDVAMTREAEHKTAVHEISGDKEMVYTLDDGQLLSIWTVISQLGLIREMTDPTDRSMLLTKAQALLTMLALEVSTLPQDWDNSVVVEPRQKEVGRFDA